MIISIYYEQREREDGSKVGLVTEKKGIFLF